MSYEVWLLGGLLVAMVGLVIYAAYLGGSAAERPSEVEEGPAARLEEALEALRELEFERHAEKLGEEDYRELRSAWAARALAARRELRAEDAAAESSGTAAEAGAGAPPAEPGRSEPSRCGACGSPAGPGDRFCGACGAAVGSGASAPAGEEA